MNLSDGILLTSSRSGTVKIQRVRVQTKPGKYQNCVKCKLYKPKHNMQPSRIPVLVKPPKVEVNKSNNLTPRSCGDIGMFARIEEQNCSSLPSNKHQRYNNILSAILKNDDTCLKREPSVKFIKLPKSCHPNEETSSIYVYTSENLNEYIRFSYDVEWQVPVLVMTQYDTLLAKSQEGKGGDESGSSDDDSLKCYLDSGLRRLKSDESKLYLKSEYFRSKKRVPPPILGTDDVQPLLKELPSDLFRKKKRHKKDARREESKPEQPPEEEEEEVESIEEDVKSEKSGELDTSTLDKLKEFEDVTFTIDPGEVYPKLPPEKSRDLLPVTPLVPKRSSEVFGEQEDLHPVEPKKEQEGSRGSLAVVPSATQKPSKGSDELKDLHPPVEPRPQESPAVLPVVYPIPKKPSKQLLPVKPPAEIPSTASHGSIPHPPTKKPDKKSDELKDNTLPLKPPAKPQPEKSHELLPVVPHIPKKTLKGPDDHKDLPSRPPVEPQPEKPRKLIPVVPSDPKKPPKGLEEHKRLPLKPPVEPQREKPRKLIPVVPPAPKKPAKGSEEHKELPVKPAVEPQPGEPTSLIPVVPPIPKKLPKGSEEHKELPVKPPVEPQPEKPHRLIPLVPPKPPKASELEDLLPAVPTSKRPSKKSDRHARFVPLKPTVVRDKKRPSKDDFGVHVEDPSGSDGFSLPATFDDVVVPRAVMERPPGDFCVHMQEPDGTSLYSLSSTDDADRGTKKKKDIMKKKKKKGKSLVEFFRRNQTFLETTDTLESQEEGEPRMSRIRLTMCRCDKE